MNSMLVRIWEKKNNNDKKKIPTHLLAYFLALIVKELKISVKQGRVVTTLNIIKLNIIISVVGLRQFKASVLT